MIREKVKAHLVEDWCHAWRWWSLRFNAAGLFILGWVQFDPAAAMSIWNAMPFEVRKALPPTFLSWIGFALFGLSMLSRVVKQPKRDG